MIDYKPTASGVSFHDSDCRVKMIMGPYGSGKSTICAMDMLYYAADQPPAPDGVRYSRWRVIRASYPNLTQTTRRIIQSVMPDGSGALTVGNAPLHGVFFFGLPDGNRVHSEFEMWSAVTGDEADKFRSANWTGVWLNEATEVSYEVFAKALIRSGRFPDESRGGCKWGGVLMDFNRPPRGHWLSGLLDKPELRVRYGDRIDVIPLFEVRQPPAAFKREKDGEVWYEVNPEAENLGNLLGGENYYKEQIAVYERSGMTEEIDALYCLLDAVSKSGKPVWPMFSEKSHVALKKIEPDLNAPAVVGCDTSGIHPAAVVLQFQQSRWCVTDELYGDQEGLETFLNAGLLPLLRGRYPHSEITIACDPANARDSYTGLAPTSYFQQAGLRVWLPPTNRPAIRISSVAFMLNLDVGGLLVSPHCGVLIEAMKGGDGQGGYHYSKHRIMGSIDVVYSSAPEKNGASHIADALQYGAMYINRESQVQSEPGFESARERVARANAARRRIVAL